MARRGMIFEAARAVHVGNGSGVNDGSGSKTLSFSFAEAGDLGIIHVYYPGGVNPATAAGWTRVTYTWAQAGSYVSVFMWKVLTASDIASGVTVTGLSLAPDQMAIGWAAYRGPTAAALVASTDASSVASIANPAFDADAGIGHVCVLHDRDNSSSPTPPAGSTLRHNQAANAGTFGRGALADIVEPERYEPALGVLTWSGLVAAGNATAAFVIELREA